MATSNATTAMPATKRASCLTLESFPAAGALSCSRRNGSKKGTTANMQTNDQLDNMRKCVEKPEPPGLIRIGVDVRETDIGDQSGTGGANMPAAWDNRHRRTAIGHRVQPPRQGSQYPSSRHFPECIISSGYIPDRANDARTAAAKRATIGSCPKPLPPSACAPMLQRSRDSKREGRNRKRRLRTTAEL